jgi:hypothetical protein
VAEVTRIVALAAAAAALLPAAASEAGGTASRRCPTVVSIRWTATTTAGVTHGRRYRVDGERLSCFVAVRLAAQLIPLRTSRAFDAARPAGYVCAALGTAANPYRPATAIGTCLQKPLRSPPPRSFSWRPVQR